LPETVDAANTGLAGKVRHAPLGILLFAALLSVMAIGSIVAGAYLMLYPSSVSWWTIGLAGLIAPTSLYLAFHLVSRTPWAWLAALWIVGLLLASSIVRIGLEPGFPGAAGLEIIPEVAAALYLLRPRVRTAFAAQHAGNG
jgi:hypothetical protein